MRRIAVLVILVLAGTLVAAVSSFAGGSTAAQQEPGQTVRADFNGDGEGDLAVGVPGESVGAALGAGVVNILLGSPSGLTGAGSRLVTQADSGAEVNETGDNFGAVLAAGDFDGDGIADLAVGAPGEDVGGAIDAGAAFIAYSPGLGGPVFDLTQNPSLPEPGDFFGAALAAGDFTNDAVDDLAIGAPGEDVGATVDAGIINIAYGPSPGVPTDQFSQPVSAVEFDDNFGFALAAGDVDGDGPADVVAGAPFEDVGATPDAGAVSVLYSAGGGISTAGAQTLTQPISAVEAGDTFGFAVATGEFDGGPAADVAASAAFEDVGATFDAGAVSAFFASAAGLSPGAAQTFTQPISAVEVGDAFGFALATGDFDNDNLDDLAVGAPFESVGVRVAAGAVSALYSSVTGFSAANAQTFTQVAGSVESDDTFGWSLAAADFNGDGPDDLGAGAPFEDVGAALDAGAVSAVPGSGAGLSIAGGRLFTQDTAGVPGGAESGDGFGGAVAASQPTPAPAAAGTATARKRLAVGS